MHHNCIEIEKTKLVDNISIIKKWISKFKPHVKYCLPIKANAYGHGLVGTANIIQHMVDYFGVSCLDEGIKLRQSGITNPIIVFGAFSDDQVAELIQNDLEITVSSAYKANLIEEYCKKSNKTALVHIKVDTGMNRIGVKVNTAKSLIDYILSNPCFNLVGIYSHLASSEKPNDLFTINQINSFRSLTQYVKSQQPNTLCHLANSGGVVNYPDSLFDMVRPGIMSYGYPPDESNFKNALSHIKPCFSLKSKIAYFKVVDNNQAISYNQQYLTNNATRVVTIPIGYGDGYRRALSNVGHVLIRGGKYKISGLICMDMFMVDIGVNGTSYVGDDVVLIGSQGDQTITIHEITNICNTTSYEILCSFNERIPRKYIVK